jgi:hypothetical protein
VTGDCHARIRGSRELRCSRRPDRRRLAVKYSRYSRGEPATPDTPSHSSKLTIYSPTDPKSAAAQSVQRAVVGLPITVLQLEPCSKLLGAGSTGLLTTIRESTVT